MGWTAEPAVDTGAAFNTPDYTSAPTGAAEFSGRVEEAPEDDLGGETAWSREDNVSYEVTTAEAEVAGGDVAHPGEGFAAWAEEHDPISHAGMNSGDRGAPPTAFGQDDWTGATPPALYRSELAFGRRLRRRLN